MPVFSLTRELVFPDPALADRDGLLAVGGDLSLERLLLAYSLGIFPWYSAETPILWWSPDPRLVLVPDQLRISRSLAQTLRRNTFAVTFDRAFREVISACAHTPRHDERGTWITCDMIEAYCRLHDAGYAHSVESWHKGRLTGGLYGVALGGVFFGESMFSRMTDASKVALVALVRRLSCWKFSLIDCQVTTGHLVRMGAREIPRAEFLESLRRSLAIKTPNGKWDVSEPVEI